MNTRTGILVIEVMLISALSGIGTYSFTQSIAYHSFSEWIETIDIPVSRHLPTYLWLLQFLLGFYTMVVFHRGSGIFTWLVILLTLPSTLVFNRIPWWEIMKNEWKLFPVENEFTTKLSFSTALLFGIIIMGGYIILSYIHQLKKIRHRRIKGEAYDSEIELEFGNSHRWLFFTMAVVLAISIFIFLIARSFESLVLNGIQKFPWWLIVSICILCIFVIAAYLYWLGQNRKKQQ